MGHSPATKPTFDFIGAPTGGSLIMQQFPRWAEHLRLGVVEVKGGDRAPHDKPARYREVVDFLQTDPFSLCALVITHKLDLSAAARDRFAMIDPHAALMAETSCLSNRDGTLIGQAKDPISSGLSLDGLLPPQHSANRGAEVLSKCAGGSTIAITWHLMQAARGADRPSRIRVSNRSGLRLDHTGEIHAEIGSDIPAGCMLAPTPADNDAVLAGLKPGSLVMNTAGLGKDAPGAPLTFDGSFPQNGIVWQLNDRGDLVFLDQANAQKHANELPDRRRLDPSHRRGVRREDPDIRTRFRRSLARRPRGHGTMTGRILIAPRSLSKGGHPGLAPLEAAGSEPVFPAPGATPGKADGIPGSFTLDEALELARGYSYLVPHCLGMVAFNATDPAKIDAAAARAGPRPRVVRPRAGSLRIFETGRTAHEPAQPRTQREPS